ncbi:MAG: flavodoxin family protein [Desulfobacter postgatei]|jgi:multimeric flavodoxin WrbA|uniref:flavodoxin family protein n=1 Tax=Desulfobacter postgatei TaxID=2293 RepID=UPI0023F03D86|nr:flavodoxin family protein [Desulfobacter postgatei]MDD4274848.1 flavodoxin family protein [Desulfobacter postgatei]
MKVILVNGSPHPKGCTFTALKTVAKVLEEEEIQSLIFHIGTKPMSGCIGCGKCEKTGRCAFSDRVNEFINLAEEADGFVFGSPVHYAAATGSMTCFMDRAFFPSFCAQSDIFRLKPGAAVVSARRSGTSTTLDQLNKYMTWAEMPVISSRYWNMVHGNTPEEVMHDLEGLQIMRVLGKNMAWFLACKQAGENVGIAIPGKETRIATNFIR